MVKKNGLFFITCSGVMRSLIMLHKNSMNQVRSTCKGYDTRPSSITWKESTKEPSFTNFFVPAAITIPSNPRKSIRRTFTNGNTKFRNVFISSLSLCEPYTAIPYIRTDTVEFGTFFFSHNNLRTYRCSGTFPSPCNAAGRKTFQSTNSAHQRRICLHV